MLTVVRDWVFAEWINDQRGVVSGLLLKPAVAVVPVRAALPDRKPVHERLIGSDAGKAETRDAIHVCRRPDAMPVNGSRFRQAVSDRQRHRIPFAPAQDRTRNGAVDRGSLGAVTGKINRDLLDGQCELGTREHFLRAGSATHHRRPAPQVKPSDDAASDQSLHEAPAADGPCRALFRISLSVHRVSLLGAEHSLRFPWPPVVTMRRCTVGARDANGAGEHCRCDGPAGKVSPTLLHTLPLLW